MAVGDHSVGVTLKLTQTMYQAVVDIHGNALTLIIFNAENSFSKLLKLLLLLQPVLYPGVPENGKGRDEHKDYNNSIGHKKAPTLLGHIDLLAEVPEKAEEPVHLLGISGNP